MTQIFVYTDYYHDSRLGAKKNITQETLSCKIEHYQLLLYHTCRSQIRWVSPIYPLLVSYKHEQ